MCSREDSVKTEWGASTAAPTEAAVSIYTTDAASPIVEGPETCMSRFTKCMKKCNPFRCCKKSCSRFYFAAIEYIKNPFSDLSDGSFYHDFDKDA